MACLWCEWPRSVRECPVNWQLRLGWRWSGGGPPTVILARAGRDRGGRGWGEGWRCGTHRRNPHEYAHTRRRRSRRGRGRKVACGGCDSSLGPSRSRLLVHAALAVRCLEFGPEGVVLCRQRVVLLPEPFVLGAQGLDVGTGGRAQIPLDVLHSVGRALGLFVQAHEHCVVWGGVGDGGGGGAKVSVVRAWKSAPARCKAPALARRTVGSAPLVMESITPAFSRYFRNSSFLASGVCVAHGSGERAERGGGRPCAAAKGMERLPPSMAHSEHLQQTATACSRQGHGHEAPRATQARARRLPTATRLDWPRRPVVASPIAPPRRA